MYPYLPNLEIEATKFAPTSKLPTMYLANLNAKDLKTAVRAEQEVQERMPPEERRQLHQDKVEYDKAVERHKRPEMIGDLPFVHNKSPEKTASLQRHENAVRQAISKQDSGFYSRNFLIDGTYHQPK